jgi:uncharacterized protein involved in type VI secretion and phage assembly
MGAVDGQDGHRACLWQAAKLRSVREGRSVDHNQHGKSDGNAQACLDAQHHSAHECRKPHEKVKQVRLCKVHSLVQIE